MYILHRIASYVHAHTTKTSVCRSKFRPALDVPTHNAAEVTEREAGLAVALWRAAGLGGLLQRARVVAGLLRPRQSAARLRPTTHE